MAAISLAGAAAWRRPPAAAFADSRRSRIERKDGQTPSLKNAVTFAHAAPAFIRRPPAPSSAFLKRCRQGQPPEKCGNAGHRELFCDSQCARFAPQAGIRFVRFINMSRHTHLELLIAELRKRGALVDGVAGAAKRIAVGFAYPRLYLELIERHSFKAFDVAGVRIHSNLRGEEENLEELLRDKILTQALCKAGFSPFGRPSTGNYDRVCFDMRRGGRPVDVPVVVMDHEAILSHNRSPKPRPLATGLIQLIGVGIRK